MNDLKIYEDIDDLLKALADSICEVASDAIETNGQFSFVLSGGNSPKKLYELLASESYRDKIDWSKSYFFFGDERFVSENDSQRNSLMVEKALFEPLKIKESHIFKVDTSGSPEEAALKYSDDIQRHFNYKTVQFDFVLLGLGDNSHTASLFPNSSVLEETKATIKSIFVKDVNMYRVTMSAPLINQAKHIAFLVFGKDKAEAVYSVVKSVEGSSQQYPARLIKNDNSKVLWFLDRNATSRL